MTTSPQAMPPMATEPKPVISQTLRQRREKARADYDESSRRCSQIEQTIDHYRTELQKELYRGSRIDERYVLLTELMTEAGEDTSEPTISAGTPGEGATE